jgi:hypothetical protein
LDDDILIANYECIRDVWHKKNTISDVCKKHRIPRSTYYTLEANYIQYGCLGFTGRRKSEHFKTGTGTAPP